MSKSPHVSSVDPLPERPPSVAKGATVRSTFTFLSARIGSDGLSSVLDALPPSIRNAVQSVRPTDELPYPALVALWTAADVVVPRSDPSWADDAGAFSIDSLGVQLYGGILRKPTPREFLTQSISLFRLYYHPGDMEVVEDTPGRAAPPRDCLFPNTTLFCQRQTGGLRRALELAGGDGVRVRHVRCQIEGDAFCEWEMHWQQESAKGTAGV